MFKAVCFDFDYTLADCTDSIVAGFQHGLTRLGWPSPDRETVRKTVGFMLEDSYSMLTGDLDPARQAEFRALFTEVARDLQIKDTVLLPGGEELLRGLKEHGVKTAIVSTKRGDTIQLILERLGLADTAAGVLLVHVMTALPYSISILTDVTAALGGALEEQKFMRRMQSSA